MTPGQIELFCELAQQRRGRESLLFAHTVSVGAVTGLTGETGPMKALERALLGQGAGSSMGSDLQRRLHAFARQAKGRVREAKAPAGREGA